MTLSTLAEWGRAARERLKSSSLKQKILLVYLTLVLVSSLYVPCNAIRESDSGKLLEPLGYQFLWSIPPIHGYKKNWLVEIDFTRVILEIVALTSILGIALLVNVIVGAERKP